MYYIATYPLQVDLDHQQATIGQHLDYCGGSSEHDETAEVGMKNPAAEILEELVDNSQAEVEVDVIGIHEVLRVVRNETLATFAVATQTT